MRTTIESVPGRRCAAVVGGVRGWKSCNGEPALVSNLGRLIYHALLTGEGDCELIIVHHSVLPPGSYHVTYFKSDGEEEFVSLKNATGRVIDGVRLDSLRGAEYRVVGRVQ